MTPDAFVRMLSLPPDSPLLRPWSRLTSEEQQALINRGDKTQQQIEAPDDAG